MSEIDWQVVDGEVNRSKIFRFGWKNLLGGVSLTQLILRLKKSGLTSKQALQVIVNDIKPIKEALQGMSDYRRDKALHNLEISVHARYAEQQTSEKIRMGR